MNSLVYLFIIIVVICLLIWCAQMIAGAMPPATPPMLRVALVVLAVLIGIGLLLNWGGVVGTPLFGSGYRGYR